jgi:hypothetical protein
MGVERANRRGFLKEASGVLTAIVGCALDAATGGQLYESIPDTFV